MKKHLPSTKTLIYTSLLACLLNLAVQEGNFYLAGFDKSWKFDLDQDPKNENAKILADKLKSEKNMSVVFQFENYIDNGMILDGDGGGDMGNGANEIKRDIYCAGEIKNINFTPTTESSLFQPYDIIAYADEEDEEASYFMIFLENAATPFNAAKIGQLKDGTNSLSEFNSTVLERFDKEGKDTFEETLILAYSEEAIEEVEDKCKIGLVIGLLFGGTLLAGGLYLLLSRCL